MITRTRAIEMPSWAGKPVEVEMEGWPVITDFETDKTGAEMFLADLGHRPMAMVHGEDVPALGPCGPGKVVQLETGLAGVLSPGEAVLFDLSGPLNPQWPGTCVTDISNGYIMLGLWGPKSLNLVQRMVSVDVERPDIDAPLFLGTSSHGIFSYVINLKRKQSGFLLACARSDAQSFFDGLVHAGKPLGLKLAGIKSFEAFLTA